MNAVIVGCGRIGARLATLLDHNGHKVCVVDMSPHAFRRLPEDFGGDTVIGTGIDEDILRQAGIENSNVFIAVTEEDNRNIMAAQVARKIFGIESVYLRIYDPVREDAYRRLGYWTVCPTTVISAMILDEIEKDTLPASNGEVN